MQLTLGVLTMETAMFHGNEDTAMADSGSSHPQRWAALAVLCLSLFIIVADTTIVNVALPTLVRQLDATNTQLEWIVDAYNLAFAALLLAAGGLGDRFGRRGLLTTGLVVFGASSAAASVTSDASQLIALRAAMGSGAAMIFPATLGIIANVFREPRERAKAIGIWTAVSGAGIALGPLTGGLLLDHFRWGSVFLINVPIVVLALVLGRVWVPTSRNPDAPRLDVPGLVLSVAGVGTLVYTIIEAPTRGWHSGPTLGGFAASALLVAAFIGWELRTQRPNAGRAAVCRPPFLGRLRLRDGRILRAVRLHLRDHPVLPVRARLLPPGGARLAPFAIATAVASVLGARAAGELGTKTVVAGGLASMAVGFAWTAAVGAATGYGEIAAQMVLLGGGLGLTSAPSTASIMDALPPAKAGVGSAVNDTTRQVGGTLGVAVIGSAFSSIYADRLTHSDIAGELPAGVTARAGDSLGAALAVAREFRKGRPPSSPSRRSRRSSTGWPVGCDVAAAAALLGAVAALRFVPGRRSLRG